MKALVVVLLLSTQHLLAHMQQDTCMDDNGQANVTLEEGEQLVCTTIYKWVENEGCVAARHQARKTSSNKMATKCTLAYGVMLCKCYYKNCNADIRSFYESLEATKAHIYQHGYLLKYRELVDCVLTKSKEQIEAAAMPPTESTTEQIQAAAMQTTESTTEQHSTTRATEQTTKVRDVITSATNTTETTSPSTLQHPKDGKSSIWSPWFIASIVFNALLVVTVIVMGVVIIKQCKSGKQAKVVSNSVSDTSGPDGQQLQNISVRGSNQY